MHSGARDAEMVEALQISGNPAWAKVVALPQVDDLGNDFPGRRPRGAQRDSGTIQQSGFAVGPVSGPPFLRGLPGEAEAAAGLCHVAGRHASFSQQL